MKTSKCHTRFGMELFRLFANGCGRFLFHGKNEKKRLDEGFGRQAGRVGGGFPSPGARAHLPGTEMLICWWTPPLAAVSPAVPS